MIREDTKRVLGVVHCAYPKIVQNEDTFACMDSLIGDEMHFQSGGVLEDGVKIFGTFKSNLTTKIGDDDVELYTIVLNDHLKPDGKVSVIHTPVRVACQNMLLYAISKSIFSARIPVTNDAQMNRDFGYSTFEKAQAASDLTVRRCSKLIETKASSETVEKLLDIVIPYERTNDGAILDSKANETVSMKRDAFDECMHAVNLNNYHGTAYQIYQAALDYDQHMFSNMTAAYDVTKRMSIIPSIGTPSNPPIAQKFLKVMKDII